MYDLPKILLIVYVIGAVLTFADGMRRKHRPAFFRNMGWGFTVVFLWFICLPIHYWEKMSYRIHRFIEQEKLR